MFVRVVDNQFYLLIYSHCATLELIENFFRLLFVFCRFPFMVNRFSLNIQMMNVNSNKQEYNRMSH